jgi:chromosome partitioning protein
MPVIAVINRKGGSGKSTLATHLAAWMAHQGAAVMLGDVDRQQSTRAWLKRREPPLPSIVPWTIDQKNVLKVPAGVTHVVLDTPGGLHGFELAKVVMSAQAILIPVCHSIFDRESAAACIAELMALPRLANGRCLLGVVGMRIDARTRGAQSLRDWAQTLGVPFLGVLRETQWYVRGLDSGHTIFDIRSNATKPDLDQWKPILQWLQPVTQLSAALLTEEASDTPAPDPHWQNTFAPTTVTTQTSPANEHIRASRPVSLMPAQESLVHGSRLSVFSSTQPTSPVTPQVRDATVSQSLESPKRFTR